MDQAVIKKTGIQRQHPRCTVEELDTILTFQSGGFMMMPNHDMDEVFEGLYIGEMSAARHIKELQNHGIDHVLNAAKGGDDRYHVNIDPKIYQKAEIKYMPIEAEDTMNFSIENYFEKTADFIDEALKGRGKVLVNCREGVSRSSTIVLAYLMLKKNMTAQEATRHVRQFREIGPNEGFLQQLCKLNETLWVKGHFKGKTDPVEGLNVDKNLVGDN